MVTVSVGDQSVPLGRFAGGWLFNQLERQSSLRGPVCVRVEIDAGEVQLNLTTPGCGRRGGSRPARPGEAAIIQEWRRLGLGDSGWSADNLIKFLSHLRGLL